MEGKFGSHQEDEVPILVDIQVSQAFLNFFPLFLLGIWLMLLISIFLKTRGLSKNEALQQDFSRTLKEISKAIQSEKISLIGTNPWQCPAVSGIYNGETTNQQIWHLGNPMLPQVDPRSHAFKVHFTMDMIAGATGWTLDGYSHGWEIEEGYLSPSGEAYWVERIGGRQILVYGKFARKQQGATFQGEWLSSCGHRGRYQEFRWTPHHKTSPSQIRAVYIGVPLAEP